MRSITFIALAIATLAASPAIAKDKKPFDPNKKVCRQTEVTGSIMPGKSICHTAAEWSQIDAENSMNARNMRDQMHRGLGGSPSGG